MKIFLINIKEVKYDWKSKRNTMRNRKEEKEKKNWLFSPWGARRKNYTLWCMCGVCVKIYVRNTRQKQRKIQFHFKIFLILFLFPVYLAQPYFSHCFFIWRTESRVIALFICYFNYIRVCRFVLSLPACIRYTYICEWNEIYSEFYIAPIFLFNFCNKRK